MASVLKRVLQRDHDVVVTGEATEALSWLERGDRYDVILSDINMPGMNGVAFYSRLLEVSAEQAERVIFMTGGLSSAEECAFVTALGDRVLEKPLDFVDLRLRIAAVMA